jgi:hypothetical protein
MSATVGSGLGGLELGVGGRAELSVWCGSAVVHSAEADRARG